MRDSRSLTSGSWTLVGWNDLGMHCMDGDYGVFSILPPYNTLDAQLIDQNGDLVTSPGGITVTYEAVADPSGSINTTSAGKTNFWQFGPSLYGASGVVNAGLAGHDMPGPGNTPQPMIFTGGDAVFRAEGIPITPYDDLGRKRYYPMMRLVARSGGGTGTGHDRRGAAGLGRDGLSGVSRLGLGRPRPSPTPDG